MTGTARNRQVLTINTGSSSLKAVLYAARDRPELVLRAQARRIGDSAGYLRITGTENETLFERDLASADHAAAFEATLDWLTQEGLAATFAAIGHRVVHGGARYREPLPITPKLTEALRALAPLNPDHLPQALCGIEAIERRFPALPQVACFDTAFHRDMPPCAQMYALPRRFYDEGIRHLGFHGLSYESIVTALRDQAPALADGRLIVAHLGNGASVAAIHRGRSIDTSMGYTPAAGLIMSMRCGDIDPGVLIDLAQRHGMDAQAINHLINREAGLLGVSGRSADMRDLLEAEATDPHAAEAVEMFCYRLRQYIGAYAATLGGLDALIFTGGIGEHAAPVRERACAGLGFLGIEIDSERNDTAESVISSDHSRVSVHVIATDENRMIARHTLELVNGGRHVRLQH